MISKNEFEKWATDFDLTTTPGGEEYALHETSVAWDAWRSSRDVYSEGLSLLTEAASSAAMLLGFLSHHLRGRLPDNALIDMADKADKLIAELEKIK